MAESQIIYGCRPVEEAERGRRRVHRVWRAPETSAGELEQLCGSPDHQGVVAEVDPYPYADPSALLRREGALLVALDQVQDCLVVGTVGGVAHEGDLQVGIGSAPRAVNYSHQRRHRRRPASRSAPRSGRCTS